MDQSDQGVMTYFEAEAHSFVMRIWRENRDDPNDPADWRGWIEHVQSGQRHYFREVKEIPAIVAGYVGGGTEIDEQVFMPVQRKGSSK